MIKSTILHLLSYVAFLNNTSGANCPDIGSVKFADVISSRESPFKPGTVLKIKCDKGYKGYGVPKLKCLEDGSWSDPPPFCAVSDCKRDESQLEKGRKCGQKCKKDKDCRGFKQCRCDDWCGKTCYNPASKCQTLTPPRHGYINGSMLSHGYRVRYGCNDGYVLSGHPIRQCRSDKKWSGQEPNCLPFSSCGQSGVPDKRTKSGNVVEGSDAEEGEWPWQVHLFYNEDYSVIQFYDRYQVFGGGSIIDDKWILTAAHVFDKFFELWKTVNWKERFLFGVGMTRYPADHESIPKHVNIFEPENVYIHQSYDPMSYDYDIALIRVGKRLIRNGMKFVIDKNAPDGIIEFSWHVRPICLPCVTVDPYSQTPDIHGYYNKTQCDEEGRSLVTPGTRVTVTGFGYNRKHGTLQLYKPGTMQEGRLKIESHKTCLDSIRKNDDHSRYTDRMLCAKNLNNTLRTDSCKGDSGGPIVKQISSKEKLKHWIQVGIVSWGFDFKCEGDEPGFYVNLAVLMPWVWKTIDNAGKVQTCLPPLDPTNGHAEYSSTTIGSNVTYFCNKGYVLRGIHKAFCTSEKNWGEVPECVVKTCPPPLQPTNGYAEYKSTTIGSTVQYFCNRRYNLHGLSKARCEEENNWGEVPKCIVKTCPPPADPLNGYAEYRSTTIDSIVTYICDKAYDLVGNQKGICTEENNWGEVPYCVVKTCPPPVEPVNGYAEYRSMEIGSVLLYFCNRGYGLLGNRQAICTEMDYWGHVPECIECEEGFEPSPQGSEPCIDIDECTSKHNYGNCGKNGKCRNSIGSYFCVCNIGYQRPADGASCEKISPCRDHRCENGGRCEETTDKSNYTCNCVEGYTGERCGNVDVRLEQRKDENTGAIHLRCMAPPTVKDIFWTFNRDAVYRGDRTFSLSEDLRELTINIPHYTHSGMFSCQYNFRKSDHAARSTLIVSALPKIACGESPGFYADERAFGPRILGGTVTKSKYAPFMAILYKVIDGPIIKKGVFCGGSLIDNRHVVTAAHCFQRISFKDIDVYVGKLQTDIKIVERYQQKSKVIKLITHPKYNPDTYNGDIAILVLEKEIYFSAGVKPICIAHPKNDDEEIKARPRKNKKKKYGIVYGYGLKDGDVVSKRLREVDVPVLNDMKCIKSHEDLAITEMMFCVGGEDNKDACKGDSGGPFTLWSEKQSRWYLAGIVSWGPTCGNSDHPGVYTRVGKSVRKWIYENSDLTLD